MTSWCVLQMRQTWALYDGIYQGSLSALRLKPLALAQCEKWLPRSVITRHRAHEASIWFGQSSWFISISFSSALFVSALRYILLCSLSITQPSQKDRGRKASLSEKKPSRTPCLLLFIVAYISSPFKPLNWNSSMFQWHFPYRSDYTGFYLLGGGGVVSALGKDMSIMLWHLLQHSDYSSWGKLDASYMSVCVCAHLLLKEWHR